MKPRGLGATPPLPAPVPTDVGVALPRFGHGSTASCRGLLIKVACREELRLRPPHSRRSSLFPQSTVSDLTHGRPRSDSAPTSTAPGHSALARSREGIPCSGGTSSDLCAPAFSRLPRPRKPSSPTAVTELQYQDDPCPGSRTSPFGALLLLLLHGVQYQVCNASSCFECLHPRCRWPVCRWMRTALFRSFSALAHPASLWICTRVSKHTCPPRGGWSGSVVKSTWTVRPILSVQPFWQRPNLDTPGAAEGQLEACRMYLYEVPDGPAAASLSQSQRRGQRGDAKGSGPAVAPRCSFACPAALLRPAWTPSPGRKPSSIQAPGWHRPGLDRLTGCRTGWNFLFYFFLSLARAVTLPPFLPCASLPCLLVCLPIARCGSDGPTRGLGPPRRARQVLQVDQARPFPPPAPSGPSGPPGPPGPRAAPPNQTGRLASCRRLLGGPQRAKRQGPLSTPLPTPPSTTRRTPASPPRSRLSRPFPVQCAPGY